MTVATSTEALIEKRPLKHKLVCGLHVPANLQLLTNSENCRKSNKFNPENISCP